MTRTGFNKMLSANTKVLC